MPRELFGFINAFKPPGPSSAAFGGWVKRRLGAAALGHWGTLDPAACGVLVLAVGKATKLLPLLTDDRKRYVFELVAGARTDTADATGKVIGRAFVPADWHAPLSALLPSMIGPLEQLPPMHSARKVDGRPLYESARRGEHVVRTARTVTIHDLSVIACEPDRARLDVTCSAGTYVRTLCEQIGERLGVPAHMGVLLRVACGPFDLRDAVRPDQIDARRSSCIIDPVSVLGYEQCELDVPGTQRFAHGGEVRLACNNGDTALADAATVLVKHAGVLIGYGSVVRRDGVSVLAPVHVFTSAAQGDGMAAQNG